MLPALPALPALAALLLALGTTGCLLLTDVGGCPHESRGVGAEVTLRPAGRVTPVASGYVSFGETRGAGERSVLSVDVTFERLAEQRYVAHLVRRGVEGADRIVVTLELGDTRLYQVHGGREFAEGGIDAGELRELMIDRALALEVYDAAGAALVGMGVVRPTVVYDWTRPSCS